MLSRRETLKAVSEMSQDECRELGRLFLRMADVPRDAQWKQQIREQIEALPEPPQSDLAQVIAKARARRAEREDALRSTGWHPDQMRRKLEELGYAGNVPS